MPSPATPVSKLPGRSLRWTPYLNRGVPPAAPTPKLLSRYARLLEVMASPIQQKPAGVSLGELSNESSQTDSSDLAALPFHQTSAGAPTSKPSEKQSPVEPLTLIHA
ncbi:hypothetical protein H2203_005274, partial [Taxawa tesnikishii (nom. ined.)]